MLPTLVFVLVVSGAVHLVNYYRDARRELGATGAAARALAVGWLPCSMATLTTAIGDQHFRGAGGLGAIRFDEPSGYLLVALPQELHAGVRRLLPKSRATEF